MVEYDGLAVRLHALENCVDAPSEPFGFVVCPLPPGRRVYSPDHDRGARRECERIVRLWRGPGDVAPATQLTGHESGVGEVEAETSHARNTQVRAHLDLRLADVEVLEASHVADNPYGVTRYQCDEED